MDERLELRDWLGLLAVSQTAPPKSRRAKGPNLAFALWRDLFEPADRLSWAFHTLGLNALRPSIALELKRAAIREMTHRHRAANPRVFGSTLRGADREDADLDLLVDALPGFRAQVLVDAQPV